MTIPKARRTLSKVLFASLLLCAAPKTALSQLSQDPTKQAEQVFESCFKAPAQQAAEVCELLAIAVSQVPNSPVKVRVAVHARWRDVLMELGRYGEAEAPARKALEAAIESQAGPTIVAQQNNLAMVLQQLGKYREAEAQLRSAAELAKKEYGAESLEVSAVLGNLARVLQAQGKLGEAESLFRKSLAIKEKKLEPDHPHLATTLGNLAAVLKDQGKLGEAESLFRKSLAIKEKKLEPDHPHLATTLGNLAAVLKDQGKLGEAESLFRKSLAIFEKKLEPDHPHLATTLGNLAGVLYAQGKLGEAESLYRKSLAIEEKKLEPDHPSLATTLGNLAGVLQAQGKLGEAESLYRKSLAIREKKLEPDHPDLATSQNNLAGVLYAQGKLGEAESLYRKSLAIREKKLEPDHPDLATSHSNLSMLRLAQGDVKGAVREKQKAMQSFDKLLRTSPSEDVAEALLSSHVASEYAVYGFPLLKDAPKESGQLAMSTALLFKGRTLEAGRMVRRKLQQGLKTEGQKQKYQDMLNLLEQRDRELMLLSAGSGDRTKAQELLWQAQKLERELSKEVGVESSSDVPTLEHVTQQVAKQLPSDAVLVEIGLAVTADYSRGSLQEVVQTRELQYVALLLYPSGEVRVVRLGGKGEVEGVTKAFLGALQSVPSACERTDTCEQEQMPEGIVKRTTKALAQTAYRAVFAPLEQELAGVRQVILSPDGALSAIPFGALHDGKGYLTERLSFRYVTSGRDLLVVPSQKPTAPPTVMMATRVPGQDKLEEAEKVGEELAKTQGGRLVRHATDGDVLEQQSPSVLTLISHGYFGGSKKEGGMSAKLPTVSKPKWPTVSKRMGLMAAERIDAPVAQIVNAEKEKTEELMNSSGLMMMAGTKAKEDAKQDGRLTAVEAREMNLQGTKLVMLLACKGAAGGVSFGQGVYGLRRSVLQAGAETVVGTLWSVEEKSASELAKKYLTKLWTDKKATRVGAMEEAMKEMRKDPRYKHPHYWAPFVVMGMDGPLEH